MHECVCVCVCDCMYNMYLVYSLIRNMCMDVCTCDKIRSIDRYKWFECVYLVDLKRS